MELRINESNVMHK